MECKSVLSRPKLESKQSSNQTNNLDLHDDFHKTIINLREVGADCVHQQRGGYGVFQVADVRGAADEAVHVHAQAHVVVHRKAHQLVGAQRGKDVVHHLGHGRAEGVVVLALLASLYTNIDIKV